MSGDFGYHKPIYIRSALKNPTGSVSGKSQVVWIANRSGGNLDIGPTIATGFDVCLGLD